MTDRQFNPTAYFNKLAAMFKKHYTAFLLFFLWFGHLVNNYIWLKLDVNYLTYDSHRHFLMSLKIFDAYRNPSFNILDSFIQATQLHPPLVGIFTAPFYFLFGVAQDTGVMVSAAIFLAILIFSTYKIGKKLMDEKAGILAAFLITIYPVVFNQLKVYMLDLPLTAFVVLGVYLLLMTDNFRSLKYSIFFGVSSGLGMLVKQPFFLFIIGPLSYVIIRNIIFFRFGGINNLKKRIINLSFSLSLSFLIACFYYLKKIYIVFGKLSSKWTETWPTPVPESSWFLHLFRSFLWYLWGFINWQISFFYFFLFLIGFLFYFRYSSKSKSILYLWILVSWILVSYLRYTIGFNMEVTGIRYTLPILPAVALITAIGIRQLPCRKIKTFFTITAVIYGIFQLFFISYPIFNNHYHKQIAIPIRLPESLGKYKLFPENIVILNLESWPISGRNGGSHPIDAQDYLAANEEIFRAIDSSGYKKKAISVFIIPHNTQLWYLQYKAYIEKKPFTIVCDWIYLGENTEDNIEAAIQNLVLNSDYIIDKDSGELGEPYVQKFINRARKYFNKNSSRFGLLKKVKWPDYSSILIFKNKVEQ